MKINIHKLNHLRPLLAATFALSVTACSSTSDYQRPVSIVVQEPQRPMSIISQDCQSQATNIANYAETSEVAVQYLTAARALQSCVNSPLPETLNTDQAQQLMHLMASVTFNYIKGGDVSAAYQQLQKFEQQFPQQDLYFADYSSFLDTANALLQGAQLSSRQLASLNISRELRDELQRQHYWLSH